MLEKFLYTMEPADYLSAVALYREQTLTAQDVERLAEVYDKYAGQCEGRRLTQPERIVSMAADMIAQGRSAQELALLGLDELCLEALSAIPGLTAPEEELTREQMVPLVRLVWNEELPLPLRIMLARTALDAMANAQGCLSMREGIVKLAGFLTSCGEQALGFASNLVGEVRTKCRK